MEPPNVDIEGHEWSRLTSQSLCRTFAHPSLDLKRDQGDKDGCKDHNRDQRSSTNPLDHPGRSWNFQVLFSGGGDPQQHTCIYFLCVFFLDTHMHIFVIFVGIGTTTWLNALKIVTLRLKVVLFGRSLISNSKIKLSLQLQFVLLQSCRKQIKLHSVLRLSKFTFKMHWRSKDYYFSQYVLITYNTKLCSLSLMLWLNQSTFLIPYCKVVLENTRSSDG